VPADPVSFLISGPVLSLLLKSGRPLWNILGSSIAFPSLLPLSEFYLACSLRPRSIRRSFLPMRSPEVPGRPFDKMFNARSYEASLPLRIVYASSPSSLCLEAKFIIPHPFFLDPDSLPVFPHFDLRGVILLRAEKQHLGQKFKIDWSPPLLFFLKETGKSLFVS